MAASSTCRSTGSSACETCFPFSTGTGHHERRGRPPDSLLCGETCLGSDRVFPGFRQSRNASARRPIGLRRRQLPALLSRQAGQMRRLPVFRRQQGGRASSLLRADWGSRADHHITCGVRALRRSSRDPVVRRSAPASNGGTGGWEPSADRIPIATLRRTPREPISRDLIAVERRVVGVECVRSPSRGRSRATPQPRTITRSPFRSCGRAVVRRAEYERDRQLQTRFSRGAGEPLSKSRYTTLTGAGPAFGG
jgi:hypothetical protein